jgi:hypothetical protein
VRGPDLIPLAMVVGLAGVVGFAAVRGPSAPPSPPASVSSAPSAPRPTPATTDAPPVTVVEGPKKPHIAPLLPPPEVFKATPRSDEINRRMALGAAGTYIFEMLAWRSSIVRWPVRPTEPLRIWVDPAPKIADWNPKNAAAARDGFKRWLAAGIPLRMNFVVDSAKADVHVFWVDGIEEKVVGITRREGDMDYWLTKADITLALHEPGGGVLNIESIRAIATHEAGHALGLEHSPNLLDIMAWNYDRQIEPSPADLMTLRLLYTIPPGRFR